MAAARPWVRTAAVVATGWRRSTSAHSSVVVPPAAVIFSLAEPVNLSAVTCTFTDELAVAENLDQLVLANCTLGDELVHADLAALGEQPRDVADVHDLVLDAVAVREALELREPHVQRHLATLEGGGHVLACLGALGTATRGLALASPHRDRRGSCRSSRPVPGAGDAA